MRRNGCFLNGEANRPTFTASCRTWPIVFGPLSTWALRGVHLLARSSTVFCSRKRILAGNSLLLVKDRMRPKYWSIKDWNKIYSLVNLSLERPQLYIFGRFLFAVTLAFSWSSFGPTVFMIWQRHSKSSPMSLSWTLFFLSKSLWRYRHTTLYEQRNLSKWTKLKFYTYCLDTPV